MSGRVLIVQYSANLDGSAMSGLLLADGLREAGWETHVAFGFDGPVIDRYRHALHQVRIVPHKSWLRTHRYPSFARILLQERQAAGAFEAVLADVEPDLVYVNTSVSLAGARAAHRRQVPCVWHLRELFSDVGGEMRVPFGIKRLVRARIRRYATRLVANSASVAANMMGPAAGGIAIVPNAVSDAFFDHEIDAASARRRLGLPEQGRIVGVPGTLRPMKGHPFFFEALKHLAAEAFTVAVTGGGEAAYAQQLQTMAQEPGLASKVRFLGYVEDMPSFYRACDVVCIPSVAEPFGRTVIEAFASATPVIATAVGGIRETIDDGVTGLLVPYGDVRGLAGGIRRLLADADLREQVRTRARRKAEAEYRASVYQARLCGIAAAASGREATAAGSRTATSYLAEEPASS